MTRLRHSATGFIRALQISNVQFVVYVEGGIDRTFFDRLLGRVFADNVIRFRVIAAREIPDTAGGKMSLLALFREMRTKQMLAYAPFGKRMVSFFVADKDIDDVTMRRVRSPHFCYTPTYDLEGHLFSCASLHRALADAAHITFEQAKEIISDQRDWLILHARNWRDWVVLCMLGQSKSVNCGCTFDRASAVNPNLLSPVEPDLLDQFKAKLRVAVNLSEAEFAREYRRLQLKVDQSIAVGDAMKFFKGKWLKQILESSLRANGAVADANINGLGDRVLSTLLAQVGVAGRCHCSSPFEDQVLSAARLL